MNEQTPEMVSRLPSGLPLAESSKDQSPILGHFVTRALLAGLGAITGGMFALECMLLSVLAAGNYLRFYKPAVPVTDQHQEILGWAWETYKFGPWLPLLLLALVLLPPVVFARCKWIVAGLYLSQFVAARAFSYLWHHFDYHYDNPLSVSSFAEIRQEMTALDRWIYSPLVDLLERGWGYWGIALHSIVLGAFWTLVVYAVYRVIRGAVQRRRSAERTPEGDPA
jgi:hypothetical protein